MDTLTHIVIGGCIGEAFMGKQLGKRAMALGAIAQSIPDIDFIAATWSDASENLLAHRGFTHSLLFLVIITPLLALISEKWHRPHNISLKSWLWFFGIQGLVHIFLDGFNVYGVGWLEPFSHLRFSFNTIFVADPFFSVWPAIAFVALMVAPRKDKRRTLWWVTGLLASSFYLFYTVYNKTYIDSTAKKMLAKQQVTYVDYFSTPTPLNNWLWYIVLRQKDGYSIGYRSVFDTSHTIQLQYFPRNQSLLANMENNESVQHLLRFSKGYYTVEQWGDTLVFNDLRFGQIIGWASPKERFVFHFYLSLPEDNKLVLQRGRFDKWDKQVAYALWHRIFHN